MFYSTNTVTLNFNEMTGLFEILSYIGRYISFKQLRKSIVRIAQIW